VKEKEARCETKAAVREKTVDAKNGKRKKNERLELKNRNDRNRTKRKEERGKKGKDDERILGELWEYRKK
jgi:hypothetical protein